MTDTLDPPAPPPDRAVTPVDIEKEMATSYLDYAMSVIVSRALPDARDGLKPVHRASCSAWTRPATTTTVPIARPRAWSAT